MVYAASIKTEHGKSEADATETPLKVVKGLIYRLEVEFPPGCCGLVHMQLYDAGYMVYPATPGVSFHGDNATIGFDDCYLKGSAPYTFIIKTWNEDDTWDHTIQVRVAMASAEAFMSRYMPSLTWEKFNEVMKNIIIVQADERRAALEAGARELGELVG